MNVYKVTTKTMADKYVLGESVSDATSVAQEYFINDNVTIESVILVVEDVIGDGHE